jgi:hypothetical protein
LWDHTYGGAKDDDANSIVALADGDVVVAGYNRSKGAGGDMWVLRLDGGNVDFQKGWGAYNLGAYTIALSKWTPIAELGNADAQYWLGVMYRDGIGVPQDDQTAVKWFTLAAEQGDAIAQTNLGMMYRDGIGVPQDDQAAVKWWTLAADQGNAIAQYTLALINLVDLDTEMFALANVNVRAGPSIGTQRLTTIAKHAPVNVTGKLVDWYQVALADGGVGYISGRYLSEDLPHSINDTVYLNACGSDPKTYSNKPLNINGKIVEVGNRVIAIKKSTYGRDIITVANSVIELPNGNRIEANLKNFRDLIITDGDGNIIRTHKVSGATSIYESCRCRSSIR